jgi:hypothetical protein
MSALAALATAVVLTGCGGDGDETDRLADELVSETGGALDDTQARCVADGLVDSFGDDSFREVLDAAEGSGEDADDVRVEVIDIFASCDALDAVVLDEEPEP